MDPLAIGTTVLSATLQIVCDRATTFTQQSFLGATIELECALEKLQMTLSIVKSMVSDIEKRVKRGESSALHTWLLNLRNVVYNAEDVLDGMEYDRLKLKAMKTTSRVRAPLRYITTKLNPTSFSVHSYVLRINVIQERLSFLLSMATVFKLEMVAEASMPISDNSSQLRMISSSVFDVESNVFGYKKEKLEIISKLLDNPTCGDSLSTQPESATKSGVTVVAVVGIGGLGKTTLAQHAFHDTKVSNHFHLKMWVCVSEDFNVDRIIEEILKDIASSKEKIIKYKKQNLEGEDHYDGAKEYIMKKPTEILKEELKGNRFLGEEVEDHYDGANEYITKEPRERLKEELKGKRFLLVLDDIWNEDVKKWNDLVRQVYYGNEGSKILVTTRKMSVVRRISQPELIEIVGLSESDTHSLLMKHAFCDVCRKDLYDIGLDITKKLKGSPLAAKTIGRILSSDLSKEHWNSILES